MRKPTGWHGGRQAIPQIARDVLAESQVRAVDLFLRSNRCEPRGEALSVDQGVEALAGRVVHRLGDDGVAIGCLLVALLNGGSYSQKCGGSNPIDVAHCDSGIAIAGKDNLTLLGDLEASLDRMR